MKNPTDETGPARTEEFVVQSALCCTGTDGQAEGDSYNHFAPAHANEASKLTVWRI